MDSLGLEVNQTEAPARPKSTLRRPQFWASFFVTVGMLLVDSAPIESLQPRAPFQSLANFPGLSESIFSSHALKHG